MRVYGSAVATPRQATGESAALGKEPPSPRRRSAFGPGRERGLTAIREQGAAVADYWKTLKARRG